MLTWFLALGIVLAQSTQKQEEFDLHWQLMAPQVQWSEVEVVNGNIGVPLQRNDVAIGSMSCSSLDLQGGPAGENTLSPEDLDFMGVILDKVVNLGRKVWDLVALGKPRFQWQTQLATALPMGTKCWDELEDWDFPRSRVLEVSWRNGFGVEVVKLRHRVIWLAGGKWLGRGQFIGYATVEPLSVDVKWGFSAESRVEIPTVYNMGSYQDPVGGMLMKIQSRVSTLMSHSEVTKALAISGRGEFRDLDESP